MAACFISEQYHSVKITSAHNKSSDSKTGICFYDCEGALYTGYGIDIAQDGITQLYQHYGGTSRYQFKISYDPKTQISIINLSNIMEENPSIFAFINQLRNMISSIKCYQNLIFDSAHIKLELDAFIFRLPLNRTFHGNFSRYGYSGRHNNLAFLPKYKIFTYGGVISARY